MWVYEYQELPDHHMSKGDSDWAGQKESRKSTSSGMELFGPKKHIFDSWGFLQQVIALSSGEAELYACDEHFPLQGGFCRNNINDGKTMKMRLGQTTKK